MGDWFLKDQNCVAFVFMIYAVIFMIFALAAWAHKKTLFFCLVVIVVCSALATYFLSSASQFHQYPI